MMSLFDVIKYPISFPPQRSQLQALPPELYNEWINKSTWQNVSSESRGDPQWVAEWMIAFLDTPCNKDILHDTDLLRKMIKEWDKK
jgi:hypothetical protein